MPLLTTCIGAYPKPDYVKLPDWFNVPAGPDTADPTKLWLDAMEGMGADAEKIVARGIRAAVNDQTDSGIDIPTDGEIARENYIHYHCRHLNGFDFVNLTEKEVRGGTYSASLPSIVGPVSVKDSSIDAVSFEDAHRHNDLALLEPFNTPSVIFGAVAIAKSQVESVEEIKERLLFSAQRQAETVLRSILYDPIASNAASKALICIQRIS